MLTSNNEEIYITYLNIHLLERQQIHTHIHKGRYISFAIQSYFSVIIPSKIFSDTSPPIIFSINVTYYKTSVTTYI